MNRPPENPSPAADGQPEDHPVTTREERAVNDTKESLRVSQDGVAEPTPTPRSTRAGRGRARRVQTSPREREFRKGG